MEGEGRVGGGNIRFGRRDEGLGWWWWRVPGEG